MLFRSPGSDYSILFSGVSNIVLKDLQINCTTGGNWTKILSIVNGSIVTLSDLSVSMSGNSGILINTSNGSITNASNISTSGSCDRIINVESYGQFVYADGGSLSTTSSAGTVPLYIDCSYARIAGVSLSGTWSYSVLNNAVLVKTTTSISGTTTRGGQVQ